MTDYKYDVGRRGRPSLVRAAAIERAILAAAGDLFLREGFDLVTMENIAAAAALSKTTLYSRYPSKEVLLDAVIRDRIAQWSVIASSRDHLMTNDMGDRIRYHACTIARTARLPEVQAFVRLVQGNGERFPHLLRAMHDAGYLYIVGVVRRDIEAAAAREGRPLRDADSVARHFVSAISGWVMQESAGGEISEARADAAALRCAELLLAARDIW
jgi:TetR/AcrR family transcriptional repressor of mexJK operon